MGPQRLDLIKDEKEMIKLGIIGKCENNGHPYSWSAIINGNYNEKAMADLIAKDGGGSIVNICSMMGKFGPDLSNYEGTDWPSPPPDYFFHKGGMFTLTRYLARVLADKKIR